MATPPNPTQPQANPFDIARKRAQQQANAQAQVSQDAIKRRQAALGNLNSGAAMAQEQQARDAAAQSLQQATEGIDAAEFADNARKAEIQAQRDFARAEREASQKFQQGMTREQMALSDKQFQQQFGLSKDQFIFNKGITEAGITGTYNGKETLAAQNMKFTQNMSMAELRENIKNNALTQMQNLKDLGLTGPQIEKLMGVSVTYDAKSGKVVVNGMDAAMSSINNPSGNVGSGPGQHSTGDARADELLAEYEKVGGEGMGYDKIMEFKRLTGALPWEYKY